MTAVRDACGACLRRTDLVAALSGRIEVEWRLRRGRPQLLGLPDAELLAWARDADAARRYDEFHAGAALDRAAAAELSVACRCSPAYPPALHQLPDPPAVLHAAGDLAALAGEGAGIVGARRASAYGLDVARALGRGLAATGLVVVSGMAMGVDSAAHAGALEGGGTTVAVLATGADRPYPARARALHGRIVATGCVVSELPPGSPPRRWAFPARNRIIAALSAATIVVEGGERSGSLITADFAAELGRAVGAVPGAVTSGLAAGPHSLLKAGAELIRGTEDVLDLLHGAGMGVSATRPAPAAVLGADDHLGGPPPSGPAPRRPAAPARAAGPTELDALAPHLLRLLEEVERGRGSLAELVTDPGQAFATCRDLGELELRGLVRRVFGGRYVRAAT